MAGHRSLAAGRQAGPGAAFGEKHRPGLAAADEAGQQVRGARAPADPFGVAAFGADRGAAGIQVEVFDVQRQDLAGAGGGLVEHPPQGLLPQRHVAAGEYSVDRRPGHCADGVEVLAAPFGAGREHRGGRPAGGASGQPGGHGAAVAVPGRRGALPLQLVQHAGQVLAADLGQRAASAEAGEQAVQHAGVAAAGIEALLAEGVLRRPG